MIGAQDSIDICTKRLAASSGDLRGALSICSRATTIAESAKAPQVTDEHVAAAVQELLSPARLLLLKSLSYASTCSISLSFLSCI
jgi:origin recognition complex subunit 1